MLDGSVGAPLAWDDSASQILRQRRGMNYVFDVIALSLRTPAFRELVSDATSISQHDRVS